MDLTNKKIALYLLSIFFFFLVNVVKAQDVTTPTPVLDFNQEAITPKANLKNELRQQIKKEVETKIKSAKDEFRRKINEFKDAKKKQIVERINNRLSTINKKRIEHFLRVLNRLEAILQKIKTRTSQAKANGKDVYKVETAISSAQIALDSAKTAVNDQAKKEYTININTETTAKNDVGAAVSGLQNDLMNTMRLVIDARHAVYKAATELVKVIGESALKSSTQSAN